MIFCVHHELSQRYLASSKCVNVGNILELSKQQCLICRKLSQMMPMMSANLPHKLTSTYECCTKPSELANNQISYPQLVFQAIRRIPFSALTVDKQPIGKGVFGKCYRAIMSSHINVCQSFPFRWEIIIRLSSWSCTSELCHSNLPWLYGITEHRARKMLILSFHGVNGNLALFLKLCIMTNKILDLMRCKLIGKLLFSVWFRL